MVLAVIGYGIMKSNKDVTIDRSSTSSATSPVSTTNSGEAIGYTHVMGMDGYLRLMDLSDYRLLKYEFQLMQFGPTKIDWDPGVKYVELSKGNLILVRKSEVEHSNTQTFFSHYVRVQSGAHKGKEGWLVERYLLDR
ncbi:MAG: hypothetical protein E4H27_10350 [Anaerolineales bacterium]|nr:MAG: hypothetical protein E4H27_10350 [Anaerolineales bacterium]